MVIGFYGFSFLLFLMLTVLLSFNKRHTLPSFMLLMVCSLFLVCSAWAIAASLFNLSYEPYISEVFDGLRLSLLALFLGSVLLRVLPAQHVLKKPFIKFKNILFLMVGFTVLLPIVSAYYAPSLEPTFFSIAIFVKILWIIIGLSLIELIFRNVDEESLYLMKYILLGCATVYIFDLAYFSNAFLFHHYEENLFLARGGVWGVVVPLFALSAARYKDWSTNLRISRGFVFYGSVVGFTGLYLIFMALFAFYLGEADLPSPQAFQNIFIVTAIVILFVGFFSNQVMAKLRILISRNFFAYRYDYRAEWIRFIQTLSRDDAPLHQKIIEATGQIVESKSGVLWVFHPEEKNFQIKYASKFSKDLPFFAREDPFVQELQKSEWVLNLKGDHKTQAELIPLVPKWVWEIEEAWLFIPLSHKDVLYGIMMIGDPITEISSDVDWETYLLLKIISKQVASYLAEEIANDQLHHAQLLESFHKRFAFVVHDLKNLINQLSMMASNAKQHGHKKEFQKDMLETLSNSVEKMKNMLVQLQSDNKENIDAFNDQKQSLRKPFTKEELKGSLKAYLAQRKDPVSVEFDPKDLPDQIELDLDKFIISLGHLIQNAIESLGETQQTDQSVHVKGCKENDRFILEVADQGEGMSEEFVEKKLFTPLKSTKEGGYGIGAYQARELLREQGFDLEVESQAGVGTKMKIILASK